MNYKKGQMGLIMVFGLIIILLFVGVLMVFGSTTINYVMDEVVPEFQGLGMVGNTNLTDAVDMTIVPANNFLQQMTWLTGVIYVIGLLGILGLAFAYRSTTETWFIPLFFVLAILTIIICLIVSITYEEFYGDTSDFGSHLKEHTLLSYMIIYSPLIMSFIIFIAGIIMFSGGQET